VLTCVLRVCCSVLQWVLQCVAALFTSNFFGCVLQCVTFSSQIVTFQQSRDAPRAEWVTVMQSHKNVRRYILRFPPKTTLCVPCLKRTCTLLIWLLETSAKFTWLMSMHAYTYLLHRFDLGVRMHTHAYTCIHIYAYTCIHMYAYTCIHMYAYTCIHMYACTSLL